LPQERRALASALLAAVLIYQAASPAAQQAAAIYFRIIVVSTEQEAATLADQLGAGASFAALARTRSNDPSAQQGGLIGPIETAALLPQLRDALERLAIGQVSAVLRMPTGYALVQRAEPPAAGGGGSGEIAALAAVGGVKFTVSVDGFSESNSALDSAPKPDDWNQDPRMICTIRQQSGENVRSALTKILDPSRAATLRRDYMPSEVIEAFVGLGQMYAYDGRMSEVIDAFIKAHALASTELPAAAPDLVEMLGIAHLHKAEIDNGIYHAPGDRCLLTGRTGKPFEKTDDVTKAIAYFERFLEARPDDLEARWLLNVAHMVGGTYPARVRPRFLIPPSAFASGEDVGRFNDIAADAGVDSFSAAGGVVVDDFDNDGELEILTSNFESCGTMQLFTRAASGRFEDRAAKAGLTDQLGGLNMVQADYNNDGCRDVLVLRGGWETAQRKSLLKNNCDGTFTDVTASSGLAAPATSTQTAVWSDIDNDGFVDLFVGNENVPAQLFRNRRDGTFEDVAPAAGVAGTGFTKAVAAADFDNDGDTDLYVSNLGGGNFLYRNNGNWTFNEQAAVSGVPGAERGFPAWFFDYDNDGWDDLMVSSYYLSVEETTRTYLKLPHNANTMKLYRNQRNGSFLDVTADAGLAKVYMPMGSNFGDIDNDGFLDMYFGSGSPSYGAMVGSVLLRNRGGRSFVDVTASSGTGELHKGHGVAWADLDGDGDQEIVFKVGGATPGDAHAFRLFDNPGHGNDWLGLRLTGVKTNRAAIGVRITVTVEEADGARRTIYRTVNSGGSFGASPLQQHIGLGRGGRPVDIELFWPTSNTRQRFRGISRNQVIAVTEMAENYTRVESRRRPLGAARAR
jgi:tetratricopeptide (TPR) repeat protein